MDVEIEGAYRRQSGMAGRLKRAWPICIQGTTSRTSASGSRSMTTVARTTRTACSSSSRFPVTRLQPRSNRAGLRRSHS